MSTQNKPSKLDVLKSKVKEAGKNAAGAMKSFFSDPAVETAKFAAREATRPVVSLRAGITGDDSVKKTLIGDIEPYTKLSPGSAVKKAAGLGIMAAGIGTGGALKSGGDVLKSARSALAKSPKEIELMNALKAAGSRQSRLGEIGYRSKVLANMAKSKAGLKSLAKDPLGAIKDSRIWNVYERAASLDLPLTKGGKIDPREAKARILGSRVFNERFN